MGETLDTDFNTPPDAIPAGWKKSVQGPDLDPQNFCKRCTHNGWQVIKHIGGGEYTLHDHPNSPSKKKGTLTEVLAEADKQADN